MNKPSANKHKKNNSDLMKPILKYKPLFEKSALESEDSY
jgi:hypothetical protein